MNVTYLFYFIILYLYWYYRKQQQIQLDLSKMPADMVLRISEYVNGFFPEEVNILYRIKTFHRVAISQGISLFMRSLWKY